MPLSDEHRKKLSISHAGQGKGRVLSAETKARMSAAQKGRVVSPEQREKLRQANLGKTYSPETNAKKSASLKIAWAKRKAS